MIKKYLILLVLYTFVIVPLSAEEESLFMYIPSMAEIQDCFALINYLGSLETGRTQIDANNIKIMLDSMLGENELRSLLFEDYLLGTENQELRDVVLTHIRDNSVDENFTRAIQQRYNTRIERLDNGNIRYNYNNELYDESINLFSLRERHFFANHLGMMIIHNNWHEFSIRNDQGSSPILNHIAGGGTNSILLMIFEHNNISLDEFKEEIERSINVVDYGEDWRTEELPLLGVLEHSNADYISLGIGVGEEPLFSDIDKCTVELNLFNENLQRGYVIMYSMNYSKTNINYPLRYRQWNIMLLYSLLSFIIP